MKYGDTLRQRSIPEWGHYNIDYDYLKDLIKHHTTPGTNKAISIPGQGKSTEGAFGDTFLDVLQTQHDRINLFVRSKSGEIERRLEHISKSLAQLQAKRANDAPGARLPARIVERYAKIDADVIRTGDEIRSLSRFQAVQRTGFTKILKKYRRWTGDKELNCDFKDKVTNQPDSLFQLDLGYLLDQYVEVLGTLRSVFDHQGTSSIYTGSDNARSPAARISKALGTGDDLKFDSALLTVPLGPRGNKATYWVHPDHIVELQVFLLQHMRLFIGSTRTSSQNCSFQPSPGRRNSSTTSMDRYFGNGEAVGLVVLDHAEAFAIKQNASTIGSNEEAQGTIGMKAAGNIRCLSSGNAAVIVRTKDDAQGQSPITTKIANVERKDIRAFLDTSSEFPQSDFSHDQAAKEDVLGVRQWLLDHESTKPIAGVVSKRTRFHGLHNNATGGIWATLDSDVHMKGSLHKDLEKENWISAARSKSTTFPHALLEVRREGNQATSLIRLLDRSHLVERVRGFSIEVHALWTCCKPSTMSQPSWVPLLDQDIRKLPEPAQRQSRRGKGSTTGSYSQSSPPYTSASNTSYDGQSSPLAPRNIESSATSAQEYIDPPPLQAFRKKHRQPFADYPPPIGQADLGPEAPRYWNEYDNPENEESGYYIYVDPDAPITFPGQELVRAWTKRTRKMFGMRDRAEAALLPAVEDVTTDDEDTADESPILRSRNYGTLTSSHHRHPHGTYFSNLFRSLRDPRHDAEVLNEHRTLLSELEARQHNTEMTKFRLYLICLATAVSIDAILGLMTITSRRKVRGEVDIGVLFGTSVTLVLCFVAMLSMKTRRERLSWLHRSAVFSTALAIVGIDVLLVLWVFRVR